MAMRDPGTPGRNPFFDHSPDAELGDFVDGVDESVDDPFASDRYSASDFNFGPEPDDGFSDDSFAGDGFSGGRSSWPGGGGDPLGTLVALVDALQSSQPEATEHLVAAAHELVLAVKTVVDATEAVLAAQRGSARSEPARPEPRVADEASGPEEGSGVRRIDLA
jgi:hypothetical protein